MTPDRTRELIEAYGVDRAKWPRDEASLDPVTTRAGGDMAALEDVRSEAGRLDGLLDLYKVEPASDALRASIVALPDKAADIRDVARIRDGRNPAGGVAGVLSGLFPKLAGLVLASVLGFMVGATDLLPVHDRSVTVDVSGLALGEDGLGGFDS
jgi:hypothetical protein